jgi:hypothetical protein
MPAASTTAPTMKLMALEAARARAGIDGQQYLNHDYARIFFPTPTAATIATTALSRP